MEKTDKKKIIIAKFDGCAPACLKKKEKSDNRRLPGSPDKRLDNGLKWRD